ncbi:MAG: radical SAM protein [Proteobacteria bacterium]|nr:radical SAM protein [Pseudomonadota bacterium]MBU1698182.1 radical SAM protein [Pseudomonadota bacterium]
MIKRDNLEFIQQNRRTYSDSYESMNWLTPEIAGKASNLREDLINAIFEHHCTGPGWQFSGTKLYTHEISPGCDLCGKGGWSCLFINGICNTQCFYCPSAQKEKGEPMTSSVEFSSPHDYANYVNAFNIKGVSFSGGEPFMTFERVLMFLKTLRSKVIHPLYTWMYTNGILVTEDKLKNLRDNGLDEIRFDISANHYKLGALKKALGIVPKITVEIPAIPEDLEKTKAVIKELCELGVNYLNLHQLRCTQFNKTAFIKRGYTFLHGPGVTILETELTALELIRYSLDEKIALPINYCSFTYRNQFQGSGAKKRTAFVIKSAHEDITSTGHIRSMSLCGEEKQIHSIHNHLVSKQVDTSLYMLSKDGSQFFFNANLWPHIEFFQVRLKVSYSTTSLKSSVSYRHAFKEVALGKKKKVVIERHLNQPEFWFEGEQIHEFGREFILPESAFPINMAGSLPLDLLNDIKKYEAYNCGLAEYY